MDWNTIYATQNAIMNSRMAMDFAQQAHEQLCGNYRRSGSAKPRQLSRADRYESSNKIRENFKAQLRQELGLEKLSTAQLHELCDKIHARMSVDFGKWDDESRLRWLQGFDALEVVHKTLMHR